jgi:hypothetical protein
MLHSKTIAIQEIQAQLRSTQQMLVDDDLRITGLASSARKQRVGREAG